MKKILMACHCVTEDDGQFGATFVTGCDLSSLGPGIAVPVKVSSSFTGQRQTCLLEFSLD